MMSSYYLVEFNFTIHIIFIRRIFVIGGRKRNKLLKRARNPVERKKSRTCCRKLGHEFCESKVLEWIYDRCEKKLLAYS